MRWTSVGWEYSLEMSCEQNITLHYDWWVVSVSVSCFQTLQRPLIFMQFLQKQRLIASNYKWHSLIRSTVGLWPVFWWRPISLIAKWKQGNWTTKPQWGHILWRDVDSCRHVDIFFLSKFTLVSSNICWYMLWCLRPSVSAHYRTYPKPKTLPSQQPHGAAPS